MDQLICFFFLNYFVSKKWNAVCYFFTKILISKMHFLVKLFLCGTFALLRSTYADYCALQCMDYCFWEQKNLPRKEGVPIFFNINSVLNLSLYFTCPTMITKKRLIYFWHVQNQKQKQNIRKWCFCSNTTTRFICYESKENFKSKCENFTLNFKL